MVTARFALTLFVTCLGLGVANAQPRQAHPPLVGVTEAVKLTTPSGFIDDVVATDDQRIAYVVADTASKAELHVYSLATKSEVVVDIAPITLQPLEVALVGQRAVVIARDGEDGKYVAAAVELMPVGKKPAGTVAWRVAPANNIEVIARDGKRRLAVMRYTQRGTGPGGNGPTVTRYQVELVALENGKRVAAGKAFELDFDSKNAKLDFKVNHWSDGMTRAHGIKAGEWDRKEDQRAPDQEATYDLVTGKLAKQKITDLFDQRRRFQTLAENTDNKVDFVRMAWDNLSVHVWKAGKPRTVELDQPITSYDPKSLQGVVNADGSAWIVLKMDPVNAEAVARKKADPEYLDIFQVGTDTKAVRKARVLAKGVRHRFGVIGNQVWLLERNTGFERGGKSLTVYAFE